ncbi:ankyrin repeat-containing domain protein [Aspergillus pseudoustus]|uniref:Ankyrin repeat-containing domain protein n=1 Tax=Aspergillus pseudoustus TaxID=1810923 RepID=A0ABR4IGG7_9EURO
MLLDCGMRIGIRPDAHLHGGVAANATMHGYTMLKFVVDRGLLALPTGNTQEDVSAVLAAIRGQDLLSLKFLFEKGVRIPPNEQESVLDDVFYQNATLDTTREMLDALLSHEVDINAPDFIGYTCVYRNLGPRKKEYLTLLFDRGADPLHHDNEGQSPLYVAAVKGHVELVRIILESIDLCHVSTDMLRIELWEAIQQASRRESWKVVRLLERYRHDHGLDTLPREYRMTVSKTQGLK